MNKHNIILEEISLKRSVYAFLFVCISLGFGEMLFKDIQFKNEIKMEKPTTKAFETEHLICVIMMLFSLWMAYKNGIVLPKTAKKRINDTTSAFLDACFCKYPALKQYSGILNNTKTVQYVGNVIFNGLNDDNKKRVKNLIQELMVEINQERFDKIYGEILQIIKQQMTNNPDYEHNIMYSIINSYETYCASHERGNNQR